MSFPRYERYRDSGLEWLGEVPEHWQILPLKRGYQVKLGKMLQPDPQSPSDELLPYLRAANIQWRGADLADVKQMWFSPEECEALRLSLGDLLISEGGDVGRSTLWNDELSHCCFQNSVNRVRSKGIDSNRFLYYWLSVMKDKEFIDALCNKSTIAHFTAEKVGSVPVPYPPLAEQESITALLDVETAKIDGLIDEQRCLIDLLKEKRQAVISHAVTTGLDHDVVMKNSGVEWLGEVPSGWSIRPVKELARPGRKTFTDGDWVESPFITDDGIRLIQTGNVGIGLYKEQGFRYISEKSFEELGCTEIFPEDVLVCRLDGPVGRACMVPDLGVRMVTSVDNTIVKVRPDVDARFVVYLMVSAPWLNWIDVLCRVGGGFRVRISRKMLGDLPVPCPPYLDQVNIADWLDQECSKVDGLIAQAESAIGLLQERRSALISAAVTGKIDVRNYTPKEAV
jgi:type I restriction enzyme S subunit